MTQAPITRRPAAPRTSVDFSLVVPAYNESDRLLRTLPEMRERLARLLPEREFEIVVVDDGSEDGTADTARRLLDGFPGRVLSYGENRGKGYALIRGMLGARGAIRLFSDADLSTPLAEIPGFLAAHAAGADAVIGSRKRPGADVERHQPVIRESMGKVFTALANILVVSGVSDFTCGFKSFTARAAEDVFSRMTSHDWSFDVEVLWLVRRLGYRLKELPVRWRDDPRTKVDLKRDTLRSFVGLMKLVRQRHSPGI
jgi:dolichyl-phosphate beta-glucosyltransferase